MSIEEGFDGRAIANLVLDQCEKQDRPVTNLALQKIVFFCHVWSLIELRRPLVKHTFEAWKHGPVLQYLYREFKEFDRAPIDRPALAIDLCTGKKVIATCELDEPTSLLLQRVINFYGRLSAGQLVELSHVKNGPWDLVWNSSEKTNPGMKISNEQILEFYSKMSDRLGSQ